MSAVHTIAKAERPGVFSATCSCGWAVSADSLTGRAQAMLRHLKDRNADPRTGEEREVRATDCHECGDRTTGKFVTTEGWFLCATCAQP